MAAYKPQGATSYSPKVASSNQAGKMLFAAQNPHQVSQAALQTAGMYNFEEATKRQEVVITQSQQHLMALRNSNYKIQRSNVGSKKELLKSEDY